MWDYNADSLRRGCRWILLAVLGNLVFLAMACGQGDLNIVRIETDWRLELGTPDTDSDSPQIVSVLSPTNSVAGLYSAFELNQQSQPYFSPGGLQIQLWEGELPLVERNRAAGHILSLDGEIVTWTHAMELKDGRLTFDILNGNSTTWGAFGAEGALRINTASTLSNLNGFHLGITLQNSGVAFGGNRVLKMILKRLRFFKDDDEVIELDINHCIHQQE